VKHDPPPLDAALGNNGQRVLEGLAGVNDHVLAQPPGQVKLFAEHPPLRVARGKIVMIIQPDLADAHISRVGGKLFELAQPMCRGRPARVWRGHLALVSRGHLVRICGTGTVPVVFAVSSLFV
jgi:hypothetical protein